GGDDGYDMRVLKLTNSLVAGTPPSAGGGKPKLFITSAIHAREYATAELMTRFAEYLVGNYGIDADATWLLDEHEIHLMLHTNPDGRKHAETGDYWRKNTNENYCGATSSDRGADLNRNFEFQWNCCGGSSGDPCWETYRGPAPATEPEVQAVQSYARSIFPDQRDPALGAAAPADATGMYMDIHSYGELALWPWGFTGTPTGNGTALQTLGRKLAFFNGYEPDQAIGLYPTDGTTVDFAYGDLGVAACLFELGTSFFQSCSSFESTILPDNTAALLYAAKVVRTPYLTAAGPDLTGPTASVTVVAPGEPVTVVATANDTRYNNSNGVEPTQAIAAAEIFADAPPWQAGATPVAMTAVDGSFDSSIEAVAATLDTTSMTDGRHTLYLRAQDAAGSWGAVSALFVWILDPASAAHVAGTVTSADGGAPLAATVSTGIFTTQTDPADGSFDLMLPAGTYDVTASAVGYGSQTAPGLTATPGVVTPHDFALQPYEVVLSDDVEGGADGWTAEGQWAITTEASASPSHSWTDSPGGDYGDDWNDSLTSATLSLSGVAGVVLEFSHIYELETGYDYGHVEVSIDNGTTWTTAASFNGTQTAAWERVELPLPALDHAAQARIRFRIETDFAVTEDGWHIDDIVLRGFEDVPPGLLFRDAFETGDVSAWSATAP
ncbi:MAG: M14 family zinc carboxypeptidase, partial [Holophagae bacterium]